MDRLAIIPARGGSKRIPRKNIRPFLGRPVIAYSIAAARASGLFDRVIVSTDDEEIAAVARANGAEVPFLRSAANSDDHATTLDVVREVLDRVGVAYEAVCCLYAAAPLVTAELIGRTYWRLVDGAFDSVFPAVRYGFPPQRAVRIEATGRMTMLEPRHLTTRSQDLEPIYHDAGMLYWLRPGPVLASNRLWTDNSACVPLGELEAQDIDTPGDWQLAELKYQLLHDGR